VSYTKYRDSRNSNSVVTFIVSVISGVFKCVDAADVLLR